MYGELMEFNDVLQRQIHARDHRVKHLTSELISLRGPVRVTICVELQCS